MMAALAVMALAALGSSSTRPAPHKSLKPGSLLRVAGTGARGFSGDGGTATRATLSTPYGLALDASGNLFITDASNRRVRKVSPGGIITTVAGNGEAGLSGDGGPAVEARVSGPAYLTTDRAGNLFIGDFLNLRVRKVSPGGTITTIAGSGPGDAGGYAGDGGPATAARFDGMHGVAVDSAGNVFIADWRNHRVRKVDRRGIITTVAGNGTNKFSGDGGPATAAGVTGPFNVAVDSRGNLFIAELGSPFIPEFSNRVRKVDPAGIITTVAGLGGEPGFSGDGGHATAARLKFPNNVVVDSAGNVFIGDWGNHRIRKVSPQGLITTIAGGGRKPFSRDGVSATSVALRGPIGLAIDSEGNLLFTDSGALRSDGLGDNECVLKVVGVAAPGLIAGRPFPKQSIRSAPRQRP